MSNRPALLGQRWATAETVVTAADASAREAMHLQQTAAMRAFQRVMQPDRHKAKRTRGARRKPAAKAAAYGLAGPAAAASSHSAPAASGPPGSGSSSSTSSESDEGLKESWRDVMRSLREKYSHRVVAKAIDEARPERSPVRDSVPAEVATGAPAEAPAEVPALPAARPPLVRGPRCPQARRGDRVVEICGPATSSEVMG